MGTKGERRQLVTMLKKRDRNPKRKNILFQSLTLRKITSFLNL